MDRFFPNARTGLGTGLIDVDTAVLKASLVRGYTYNGAHTFVSDLTGAGGTLVATSSALTTVSFTDGVLDADDPTFNSVPSGAAIDMLVIYQASAVTGGADVAASAQRLICLLDGKQQFTIAAAASAGATAAVIDKLLLAIANGAVASRVSGTGAASITLAAAAAAGARSLTTAALAAGGAVVEDVYEVAYSGTNLPITPNGGNIGVVFNNGANKIIRI